MACPGRRRLQYAKSAILLVMGLPERINRYTTRTPDGCLGAGYAALIALYNRHPRAGQCR